MKTENAEKRIKELEKENQRLKIGISELGILNEIAVAISSTLSLDKIIELVINKSVKRFSVEQGAVLLLDKNNQDTPFHTMIRKADKSSYSLPYRLNTQITGWMLKNQKPLIANDIVNDSRFAMADYDKMPVSSLLSVPLMLKGNMNGLLCLFNKKDNQEFTEDDKRLLMIIGTESAQVIENARLLQEEQKYISIREELRLASDIQKNLLPQEMPEFAGYDISAINIPAKEVSGDYYDLIPMPESKLAFCLGDVSGKGMPAALLMANLQATLRGQIHFNNTPKACITYANSLLFNSTGKEKFVTLFYGMIDMENHEVTICNAGHDPPILLTKKGEAHRLETGGIVLGFMPQCDYDEEKRKLQNGDVLLIYSDGISEAMNSEDEELGVDTLNEILEENKHRPAQQIIDEIIREVRIHSEGMDQMDDMTLMVIKRDG